MTYYNRVMETSTSTGTGDIVLSGAVELYQSFADAGVSDEELITYVIEDRNTGDWEIGNCTVSVVSGVTTLLRSQGVGIINSSNNNDIVDFQSGEKHVFISTEASDLNGIGRVSVSGSDTEKVLSAALQSGSSVEMNTYNFRGQMHMYPEISGFSEADEGTVPVKGSSGMEWKDMSPRLMKAGGAYFDGSTYLSGNPLTGIQDGKKGTFFAQVRFDNSAVGEERILGAFPYKLFLSRAGNGTIVFQTRDNAGNGNLSYYSASILEANVLYNILLSYDLSNGYVQCYFNETQDNGTAPTILNVECDYTVDQYSIGATHLGSTPFSGDINFLYFNSEEYIDLSVESNRRKFYDENGNVAALGTHGEKITGRQPILFLGYDEGADFAKDRGSNSGSWTVNGTLTSPTTETYCEVEDTVNYKSVIEGDYRGYDVLASGDVHAKMLEGKPFIIFGAVAGFTNAPMSYGTSIVGLIQPKTISVNLTVYEYTPLGYNDMGLNQWIRRDNSADNWTVWLPQNDLPSKREQTVSLTVGTNNHIVAPFDGQFNVKWLNPTSGAAAMRCTVEPIDGSASRGTWVYYTMITGGGNIFQTTVDVAKGDPMIVFVPQGATVELAKFSKSNRTV